MALFHLYSWEQIGVFQNMQRWSLFLRTNRRFPEHAEMKFGVWDIYSGTVSTIGQKSDLPCILRKASAKLVGSSRANKDHQRVLCWANGQAFLAHLRIAGCRPTSDKAAFHLKDVYRPHSLQLRGLSFCEGDLATHPHKSFTWYKILVEKFFFSQHLEDTVFWLLLLLRTLLSF